MTNRLEKQAHKKIDPCMHCCLIYGKVSVNFGGKIITFQQTVLEQFDIHMKK